MLKDYLCEQIRAALGFFPTKDQELAIQMLSDFALSDDERSCMLIKGFAGTGKTSLTGAFVKVMEQAGHQCVLMAPTGRAAKVMSVLSGHQAYTIHRKIYRQDSADYNSSFSLNFNKNRKTIFIVDEASMIANIDSGVSMYGSGRLLDDLVEFVYGSKGCRLIFVGDTAQLPPVGESLSPAMNASFLESYMLHVSEVCLRDVVRQDSMSGILLNATNIRNFIDDGDTFSLPSLRLKGHGDVCSVPGNELIEELASAYSRAGVDDTIVVTRSNKRANIYNRGIRAQILGREEELESGDMLMVAKNNYFWTERECDENGRKVSPVDFIANGDILRVERVRNFRELYGFRFATCTLSMPDYDDYEMEMDVILDTLHTETPSLSQTELDKLSERVLEDYPELTNKKDKMKMLKENNYFNALQIKYAYAVTCHKAQGGQWSRVFVDQGYVTDEMMGADYYRWLYTAITRASEKLYLVNWPENQVQDE